MRSIVSRDGRKPGLGGRQRADVPSPKSSAAEGGEKGAVRRKRRDIEVSGKRHPERRSGEDAFDFQKRRFLALSTSKLLPYSDQFVVSHNGQIVDSDFDLPTLTRRYFGRHSRADVYITKVGGAPLIVDSPELGI